MIRLIGAVLLAGGSSALGFGAVRHLEGRVRDLRELVAGLEVMERELGWRMASLPELLERAALGCGERAARFFHLCAQGASHLNGRTLRQVWLQAEEASGLVLEPVDRLLLEQLGAVLGRYDAVSQRQALTAAVGRLEEQRLQAQRERQRLGRVYGTLGVAAGALLVILLI